MFLRINQTLLPLDGTIVNLAGPDNTVILRIGARDYNFAGDVAEAARAFFTALETKGQVVDLGATFKRAKAKAEIAAGEKVEKAASTLLRTPSTTKALACPLNRAHDTMTGPCPACAYENAPQSRQEPSGKPDAPGDTQNPPGTTLNVSDKL